jgi:2-polyprenyl-3-methyl-5-hydroxy-6-metoxy-1,4-benzoquinol methylase
MFGWTRVEPRVASVGLVNDSRPGAQVSDRWAAWRAEVDLAEYEARWQQLEAAGANAHGEADLVASYQPSTVLDAGCGMGRVGIELDRRGIQVQGADLDDDLLAAARRLAPHLLWHHADLATMNLATAFDVVVMAGNVMLFCRPDVRALIVTNLAAHMSPGGRLISGFSLERRSGALTLADYHEAATAAGLELEDRWSTWERSPFGDDDRYAVTVFRKPSPDR